MTWPDLPRPPRKPKRIPRENLPACGRKFCSTCGRWRLLVDFDTAERSARGVTLRWTSRCRTCERVIRRTAHGWTQRQFRSKSDKVRKAEHNAYQARRRKDPELLAKRREADRMYKAAQRRRAGIPPRPFTKPRPYETIKIDNAPVREVVERADLSLSEIAQRMGMTKRDTSSLARALGIMPSEGTIRTTMKADTAAAILRAIDVDPVDIGV